MDQPDKLNRALIPDNPGQYTKGTSGNPRGRPKKGNSLAEIARTFLEQKDPDRSVSRRLALVMHAYDRVFKATFDSDQRGWAEWLANRAYGKPVDPKELSGNLNVKYEIVPRDPRKGEDAGT